MSFTPDNALVWTEIPVTDLDKGIDFYGTVFGFEFNLDEMGPNPTAMIKTKDGTGIAGHLYPGKPAKNGDGLTVHLSVPDTLEATAERFSNAGGTVISEPVAIPPGRFQYGVDPDGNSIGLFETSKG